MCDNHPSDGQAVPSVLPRRRLKIDEIDLQWHCTIIGTCLTLRELKALAAKFGLPQTAGPGGYTLHAMMVHLASRDKALGKALTKLLDRKYAAAIARWAKTEGDDAFLAQWAEALDKGEIAGACWAIMSHPRASAEIRTSIFQEVHMLSHQVGATARADLRHLHQLEKDKAELEARSGRQHQQLRERIREHEDEIRDLHRRLDDSAAQASRLSRASEAADELDRLRTRANDLEGRLAAEAEGRRAAERESQEVRAVLAKLDQQLSRLSAENAQLLNENQAYELRLAAGGGDCLGDCGVNCERLDLCGRCILFVGGRHQHVPHLRRLVEDCNGVFAHHDGGVETSMSRLHGLLGRADAVLFPVDCISHSAQDAVKQLCRRWQKPFVPVRRSGLGGYLAALAVVAGSGEPS